MPTIDDLSNTKSDIDYFDNLLKRAEKRVGDHPESVEFDFVEQQRKKYNRQGDGMSISDADLERLTAIASGDAKLRSKPLPREKKTVRKSAKKKKTVKAAAKKKAVG